MSRRPFWACPEYERHGDVVCAECLCLYGARSHLPQARDTLPPRVTFGQGWFSVDATHWFEASNATLFPSRDGRRLLAQAACGGICEVTIAWAPRPGNECRKCLRALRRATSETPGERADSSGPTGAPPGRLRRLYRGWTKPHELDRVRRDRTSGTDFTDCPYTALSYATGPKGTVLVLDVPEGAPRVSEELWLNSSAKRFMIWVASTSSSSRSSRQRICEPRFARRVSSRHRMSTRRMSCEGTSRIGGGRWCSIEVVGAVAASHRTSPLLRQCPRPQR